MKNLFKEMTDEFIIHKENHYTNSHDLNRDIFNTMKKYFQDRKHLNYIIDLGIIVNEYNNIKVITQHSPDGDSQIMNIMNFYYSIKNNKKTFKSFASEMENISKGINNYCELSILEHNKNIDRLDLFTKICFKELGDLIEGSIKPFIELIYKLISFEKSYKEILKTSYGTKLDTINQNCFFTNFFKIRIHDQEINLTQFRNIAYHNDYSIDNEKVICFYGHEKRKEITFEKEDLLNLSIHMHSIYIFLKLSYTFFSMDNIFKITKETKKIPKITDDSIFISACEIAQQHGYNVRSINQKSDCYEIEITELKRFNNFEINIKELGEKMSPLFSKNLEISITPIFDKPKMKLLIVKSNK